jgi:cell wall-associated NlpC family hydrolase
MLKSCKPLFSFFYISIVCVTLFAASPARAEPRKAIASAAQETSSFLKRYSDVAQEVLLKGLELVGIRYNKGGSLPETGLDCSGFVQLVYQEAAGLVLPRTAREQSRQGREITRSELQPGDLVFFNTMCRAFSHVGIYLGDNYFLHAPNAGKMVRLENMQNRYWVQRYNGARRLIQPEDASAGLPATEPADGERAPQTR